MIIKNRFTGDIIIETDNFEDATDLRCADLNYLDLSSLDLQYIDFSGASICDTNLEGANLQCCIFNACVITNTTFEGSDLRHAMLYNSVVEDCTFDNAILSAAELRFDMSRNTYEGAIISWSSHDMLADILYRASGDDIEKIKAAGYVLINRQLCWAHYQQLSLNEKSIFDWAINEFRNWIKEDDTYVPLFVTEYPNV